MDKYNKYKQFYEFSTTKLLLQANPLNKPLGNSLTLDISKNQSAIRLNMCNMLKSPSNNANCKKIPMLLNFWL
ncbi:Uncharacterized protein FWK35_00001775 [Aphis craccivora]|uniref:Uncharacterized protein n=1 Tax=Aphis craccivora TaxID=307492 RepID=A0A6G0Z2R1_APHCR|nr:Uncharacterized protein FWK35_00001775 [Aphis craccivora]